MKFAFGFDVGGMGRFGGGEATKEVVLAIHPNVGLEFPAARGYAKPPRFIVAVRPALVLRVKRVGCFAQITKAIVTANGVFVVNLVYWPAPVNVEPSEAVREIRKSINPYPATTTFLYKTGYITRLHVARRRHFPPEHPGVAVVIQKLPKPVSSQPIRPTVAREGDHWAAVGDVLHSMAPRYPWLAEALNKKRPNVQGREDTRARTWPTAPGGGDLTKSEGGTPVVARARIERAISSL